MDIIILFLSDGEDEESDNLIKELNELKSKYGERIKRWWNIGFGPSAESTVMKKIVNIMKSDKCNT